MGIFDPTQVGLLHKFIRNLLQDLVKQLEAGVRAGQCVDSVEE